MEVFFAFVAGVMFGAGWMMIAYGIYKAMEE